MNPMPQISELKVPDQIKNVGNNLGNSINDIKSNVNSSVSGFSQQAQAGVGASTQFLQSNTIFAKFAFLLLSIIVFVLLIALGIFLIQYFLSPPSNPYVIKGMIDGTDKMTISQDPKNSNSVQIIRSNNQSTGLEFTWSFWLYIKDLNSSSTTYQHVFNKGDTIYDSNTGIASVNNAPGVYIAPGSNSLRIIMDTMLPTDLNIIDISNVPIRKWFHTAIRVQNTIMDVYINGIISTRYIMNNVPKQNYNDINYAQNGGFIGNLSNLRYYSSALNVFQINSIVMSGPDTKSYSLSSVSKSKSNNNYTYISNSWYNTKLQ
jgi:hypothetical protein